MSTTPSNSGLSERGKFVFFIAVLLIIAMTVLVVLDREIPDVFMLAVTGLISYLIGAKVTTNGK